jgi:hypothetical protein
LPSAVTFVAMSSNALIFGLIAVSVDRDLTPSTMASPSSSWAAAIAKCPLAQNGLALRWDACPAMSSRSPREREVSSRSSASQNSRRGLAVSGR